MLLVFRLTLLILVISVCNTFAQKTQVLIARNSVGKLQAALTEPDNSKKQIDAINEGLKAIESAEKDNKTKNWSEVYAIKSYLSSYASIIENDTSISTKYFDIANEAILNATKLDKYESNMNLIEASKHNLLIKKQERATQLFFNYNYNEALDDLAELSNHFKRDSTLALNTAICALNTQNYDVALEYLKRAQDNDIKNPAVFQNLAQLYSAKYDTDNALKTLETGLALNPYNTAITNDYINLLLENENYEKATLLIENNIKSDKEDKLLYYLYGYLKQNSGNIPTAILAYQNALDIDPNYADALFQMGLAYIDKANEKATESNEKEFEKYINLAQFALTRANEINPNDRRTIKLLIDIYSRKNAFDKVQELNRKLNEF